MKEVVISNWPETYDLAGGFETPAITTYVSDANKVER
jgi:hypothetical protein